jgi:hypothetical protein
MSAMGPTVPGSSAALALVRAEFMPELLRE